MSDEERLPGGHTEDNRPPRYEETDSEGNHRVVYRASGWGACDISLGAMAIGNEGEGTPAFMQEKYNEGHRFEPVIVAMMEDGQVEGVEGGTFLVKNVSTKRLDGEQMVAEFTIGDTEIDGEWVDVVCRTALDGIGNVTSLGNGEPLSNVVCVTEVKALGKTYWDQFVKGTLKLYDWQISTQMHGTGKPVLIVAGEKVQLPSGKVIIRGLKAKLYTTAPVSKVEMAERMRVREAKVAEARAGKWDGTCAGPHVYPCPHYYLHAAGSDVIRESNDEELKRLVGYRQQLKGELKTLQGLIDNCNQQIESWLQKEGMRVKGGPKLAVRADQLGNEKTYTVEWYEGDRDAYTVAAGKVKYVLVKEATKKDLAAIVRTATDAEVEEVFVAIENDASPRGVPQGMIPVSAPPAKVVVDIPKSSGPKGGSGRMML